VYLRTVRLEGDPEDLEKAIRAFDHVSMPVRRLPGCAAVALLADRKAGRGVTLTYWETEASLKASEEAAADARALLTAEHDLTVIDVERYEVAVLERREPLKDGTYARLICGRGDAQRAEKVGLGARDRTLPIVKRQKGFRSVMAGFNRRNGRVIAGSCWETAADRQASDAALAAMRLEVMQAAGVAEPIKVENYEVVFADIRVAAGTA